MNLVPIPRSPGWVARALHGGVSETIQARSFLAILVGSLLLTSIMALQGFGMAAAGILLMFASLAYGFVIREGSRHDRSTWFAEGVMKRGWQLAVCLAIGLLLVSPWLLSRGGPGHPPRFTKTGLLLTIAAVIVIPMIMLGTFARDNSGRGGFRVVFSTLLRHPIATLMALAVVPTAFVALEAILIEVARYQEIYPFLVIDLFPRPDSVRYQFGMPYIGADDYRAFPLAFYEQIHLTRIRQGYSLILGVTGSLASQTDNGFNPWGIYMTPRGYHWVRFFYVGVFALGMLAALAVQARWLGLLATLRTRRTAS